MPLLLDDLDTLSLLHRSTLLLLCHNGLDILKQSNVHMVALVMKEDCSPAATSQNIPPLFEQKNIKLPTDWFVIPMHIIPHNASLVYHVEIIHKDNHKH